MESLGSAFSAVLVGDHSREAERDHRHDPRAGRHRRHSLLRQCGLAHDLQHEGGYREFRCLRLHGKGDALSRTISRNFTNGAVRSPGVWCPRAPSPGSETVDMLVAKLECGHETRSRTSGIAKKTILRQSLITPSCGLGSLTPDKAEAILKLLGAVSGRMQKLI